VFCEDGLDLVLGRVAIGEDANMTLGYIEVMREPMPDPLRVVNSIVEVPNAAGLVVVDADD